MKLGFVAAIAIATSLALSACSGESVSMPSSSESSTAIERNAAPQGTIPVSVENQLKDWWGSDGIPITWKVSEVDNFDWEGNRRPDHAPPNGFQGLMQKSFSGSYQAFLEGNPVAQKTPFVLTPVASIDSESVELTPIRFFGTNSAISAAGIVCRSPSGIDGARGSGGTVVVTASLSQRTSRGLLMYDVVMDCTSSDTMSAVIRNYQKP